jgi:hypothetical protein
VKIPKGPTCIGWPCSIEGYSEKIHGLGCMYVSKTIEKSSDLDLEEYDDHPKTMTMFGLCTTGVVKKWSVVRNKID